MKIPVAMKKSKFYTNLKKSELNRMKLHQNQNAIRRFFLLFLGLLFAGWVLGALHKVQWVLLAVLLAVGFLRLYRKFSYDPLGATAHLTGFLITLVLGTSCELWGTYNQYWTYHDIPAYQLIPVWIPVAWGFTYFAFHLFEKYVCEFTTRPQTSLLAIALTSLILPTVGEYIPIYMGVWTYHWPYQLMGVPVLASLGIWAVHTTVFLIMRKLSQKYQFDSPVYRLKLN